MAEATGTATRPTEIPAFGRPDGNRRVLLVARPTGVPQASDFRIETGPVPEPGEGQVLVRTIYLSVDPAQRGWASAEANYSQPVALGSVMRALATGIVVASRDPAVALGEYVYGFFGWQDYAAVDASAIVMRLSAPIPLSACANLLGINGLTAYFGLIDLGRPREGDTLLVSTAAGGVGGFVGQIGRLKGCRTLGLTGSDEKAARCLSRYGYAAAFNYRTADLDAVLGEAAPDGLQIYFDNTGGSILDTALRRMAIGGRIVQCGTAATSSWTPPPTGPRNEREIMTRRLVWSGIVCFDHRDRFPEAAAELTRWYVSGALRSDEDVSDGIEHAPGALAEVYAGANRGKKLVYVG